uniref:snRNA-activating protein complex subunit 4 n=1 Tax=Anopheles dirus TaxID=7168 RepID=A0A182NQY4_9DIPT
MSSYSSDYESSYYTESEAESDFALQEDVLATQCNYTLEVEDILRKHVDITTTNAIGLNHQYKAKLMALRAQLESLLSRCQSRLRDIEKSIDEIRSNAAQKVRSAKPRHPGYICGQPFFKDHERYPGPHNMDYLYRKNVKKEFFPLDLFEAIETLWTGKDKQAVKKSVRIQAYEFLQRENELREKMCDNSTALEQIRNEKLALETLSLEAIWTKTQAYDGKYGGQRFIVDWLRISNTAVNSRHTAAACEAIWNNYLRPGLKRSVWTTEEESRLMEAAEAHQHHRWDRIAQCVTERSEYQCFVHYQTNFSEISQIKKLPWTQEEDDLLLRLVEENRIGDNVIWNKVVERMPYRNKVQVYHRFKYTLSRALRGVKFTAEEDCVITAYVQQFGDDFKFFPEELLPGRTSKQVSARYTNTLRFVNTHTGWNLEEDKRLMSYIAENLTEEGPQKISWAECAKFLGNHSRLSCRSRYYTIEKFLERHPNATLDDVPRREKKKLSSSVTDKNWIKTIVGIKSAAPNAGAHKTGSGNPLVSSRAPAAEWSLYELMKFSFRYKFGYRLAVDARHSHVFAGTRILLHLLEGFHNETIFTTPTRILNSRDTSVLHAVLQSPLDWPNLVSIMRPTMTPSGEAMLFCRIPPSYNTVLGLRGVCLSACSPQTNEPVPESKVRKRSKLNEIAYHHAMAVFVERFRKIFHWTMLLTMLNIDDVTLENERSMGNSATSGDFPAGSNDPGNQITLSGNLIFPVHVDKLMNATTSAPGVEQNDTCSYSVPTVDLSSETNVGLMTNITIIDPKDLPTVSKFGIEKDGTLHERHIQSEQQNPRNYSVITEYVNQEPSCSKTINSKPAKTTRNQRKVSSKKSERNTSNENITTLEEFKVAEQNDPSATVLLQQHDQRLETDHCVEEDETLAHELRHVDNEAVDISAGAVELVVTETLPNSNVQLSSDISEPLTAVDIIRMLHTKHETEYDECSAESDVEEVPSNSGE